jgi:hypothetical protein
MLKGEKTDLVAIFVVTVTTTRNNFKFILMSSLFSHLIYSRNLSRVSLVPIMFVAFCYLPHCPSHCLPLICILAVVKYLNHLLKCKLLYKN